MEIRPRANSVSSDTDTHEMHETVDAEQVLYRFLVDSLTEFAVFAVSPTGIVISWNVGAEKLFGYTQHQIVGKSFEVIFTAEDRAAGAPQAELASALSGEQTQHDRWHVRKDQSRFWGTNTVQPIFDASTQLIGFTKLVRDSTQNHLSLQELSDSEQQLRLLIESVRDYAIFALTLEGAIKNWNEGAEKVFGYGQSEAIGRNYEMLFSDEDRAAGVPHADLRRATTHGHTAVDRWLIRKDGSRLLASGKLNQLKRAPAGEMRGFVAIAHDITHAHAVTQDLQHQAQHDELTELPNRRMFYAQVQQAIASIKRRPSRLFAVLFVDVDHFKAVNDEHGHVIADELLAVTARRLLRSVRAVDTVARIGGDEFAILLTDIGGVDDASEAANRIGIEMRLPFTIDNHEVRATASIGIALASEGYELPEDILRDADSAMYAAKTAGRACSVVFDSSMSNNNRSTFDFSEDIRQAIKGGELRIAFQPIICVADGRLTGFESLVRWQHPLRGLLKPADFIPRAEQTDIIVSIDRWVIEAATNQLARWLADGCDPRLQMSINVSSKEFSFGDFLGRLREVLATSGLAGSQLRLEITESALMENSPHVSELLAEIRKLGIAIDVDDFGTGYSSLGSLQHMSVDGLKIDSSFVAGLDSSNGANLVETVLVLAQKLELVVIAEGIETTEQLARLSAMGCQYGQGFLFAEPLSADEASSFLADRERTPHHSGA